METRRINDIAIENLLQIFEQVYTNDNLLVLDTALSPIINYLIPFKQFKARAKFDKVILSDNINYDILQEYQNIIILADENSPIEIPGHARVTVIVKNLTKMRLYEMNRQFNLGLNFDRIIENKLEMTRVKGIKIFNWRFHGIVIDEDIISLQGNLNDYFDQPIYQINELSRTLVHLVLSFNIKINNIYAQGYTSNLFLKHYENKIHEYLDENYNPVQQEFYLNNMRGTHNLIVIERNVDFLPLVMSQLTYVGLIDNLMSIKINLVKLLNEQQKEEQIKIEDELFDKLKFLNFSLVGPKLNKLARWIKNQYSSNSTEGSIKDIKNLVSNLSDLNRQQDLVKKHTNVSEVLLNKVQKGGPNRYNEYEVFLAFENEIFQLTYKQQVTKILEFLQADFSSQIVVNSLVLVSIINQGIRTRDFEQIKSQAYENYGITFIYTVEKLFKYSLIRLSDTEQFQTYTEGVTGGINVHKNNYTLLSKFWNLHPEEELEEIEINGIEDYLHPSFTLPSNTVPLTVRLVEALFQREFLTYKPINKITKQPSWENLGIDKIFKGPVTEKIVSGEATNTILVFIGGITWSEILCLQYLNQKLQSKKINHQFTVVTNGIVNNESLMKSVDP